MAPFNGPDVTSSHQMAGQGASRVRIATPRFSAWTGTRAGTFIVGLTEALQENTPASST